MTAPVINLGWPQLQDAPETAGVYAWYVRLFLGEADLAEFETAINAAKTAGEQPEPIVVRMLQRHFFHPFRESPYEVRLTGPLKPRYSGSLEHEPKESEGLVRRLVDDPRRLRRTASLLGQAAPYFTAPLYIGMAANLRSRLMQHKNLIRQLIENPSASNSDDGMAGFARQVVARGFIPNQMFVAYMTLSDIDATEQVDVENILNRINFPIFGRN